MCFHVRVICPQKVGYRYRKSWIWLLMSSKGSLSLVEHVPVKLRERPPAIICVLEEIAQQYNVERGVDAYC